MRYKCVTLWHREVDGSFKRMLFEKAVVSEIKALKGLGTERTDDSSVRTRIYSISECGIALGDRFCIGYDSALIPPDDAYTVTLIKENLAVTARLRHYKIEGK